jgi:hypothetical protein
MSKFISKLCVTYVSDAGMFGRPLWQLTSPLIYASDVTGDTYTVPTDFQTDFATIPRIPFVFDAFGDSATEAATLHDWLYTEAKIPREKCDAVFKEAMRASNVGFVRRKLMYYAVRLFGSAFYGKP